MITTRSWILIVCVWTSAAPAWAEDRKAQARELDEKGLKHLSAGEYDKAIEVFNRSYDLSNTPLVLFHLGQAYRLKGDCTQALRYYKSYLRDEPVIKNQGEVSAAMAQCNKSAAPPSSPTVERPVAQSSSQVSDTEEPPARGGSKMFGIVTTLAGVALAGGGVYFALSARSDADQVAKHQGPWDASAQALQDSGKRNDLIGTSLIAVGGVAIVTGGLFWLFGGTSTSEHVEASAAPLRGGMSVAIAGRF